MEGTTDSHTLRLLLSVRLTVTNSFQSKLKRSWIRSYTPARFTKINALIPIHYVISNDVEQTKRGYLIMCGMWECITNVCSKFVFVAWLRDNTRLLDRISVRRRCKENKNGKSSVSLVSFQILPCFVQKIAKYTEKYERFKYSEHFDFVFYSVCVTNVWAKTPIEVVRIFARAARLNSLKLRFHM